MKNYLKIFITTACFAFSFNTLASPKVIATVNGADITQARVENFMLHVKESTSFKDALSEIITIEALVSYRLKKPIKKDSLLQLELQRTRKAMIAANVLETLIASFKMTDEELKSEYQKQYLSADATQEYNASHILVKSKDKALKIIQSLNENKDFEALAQKYSTGPSGKNGGSLGWFSLERMVKPFSQATAALSKGKYTQSPIKTQFGWHIIKLNDKRKKAIPTLKSVTEKIKRRYAAQKLNTEIQKIVKTAHVVNKVKQ